MIRLLKDDPAEVHIEQILNELRLVGLGSSMDHTDVNSADCDTWGTGSPPTLHGGKPVSIREAKHDTVAAPI